MNATISDINTFVSVIKQHLDFVKSNDFKFSTLYKKIICVGIIDLLSKTVYPNVKYNRTRVKKYINNYAPHCIWNKVSLGHLIRLLELTDSNEFIKIEEYAKNKLGKSNSPAEPRVEFIDPDYHIIKELWPSKIEKINKIKLTDLKHVNLFYNYRNNLVHELRRPGGLIDDNINHKVPFYYGLLSDNYEYFWKLVYPLGFFYDICTSALANTKKHYLNTNTNPYKIVGNSDYLIDLLN